MDQELLSILKKLPKERYRELSASELSEEQLAMVAGGKGGSKGCV